MAHRVGVRMRIVRNQVAFWGSDTQRYILKYRFPAAAYDLERAGRAAYGPAGPYGRVVRIRLDEHDRRIFTPLRQSFVGARVPPPQCAGRATNEPGRRSPNSAN